MSTCAEEFDDFQKRVTAEIRREVQKRNLTYEDLVELTKLSRSSITRLVAGNSKIITFRSLVQFYHGLGMKLEVTTIPL